MGEILDDGQFTNPYIQVIWEDTNDNFTQEKISRVRTYFEKKYGSKNVNIITKLKVEDGSDQSVDIATNILDTNFQRDIIVKFLKTNGYEEHEKEIFDLDRIVEDKISSDKIDITPFKKWIIKNIKFSNFLSYGDNQIIDFDKIKGIASIESDPPNFGGKSIGTVDLLLFLFFNTTTKTSKAEEIFNRFRDTDNVKVEGEITIDGEDYIIIREIIRKKKKTGDEYTVSTKLDFFKKLSDGSLINFTGEQRRETEEFIKKSIGSMDDFLMTILTTGTNLEELIDSKPTARGQVLSRFLGLDSLKLKEESAKELYSTFSKTMLSNIYNSESLKQDIETHQSQIETEKTSIQGFNEDIDKIQENIKKGQDYRDEILKKKYTDLDVELLKINPQTLEGEIFEYDLKITKVKGEINEIKVIEPTEYYHENIHDEIKKKLNDEKIVVGTTKSKIEQIETELKKFEGGLKCQYCDLELLTSDYSDKKRLDLVELKEKLNSSTILVDEHEKNEKQFTQLKKEFDEYERNKLIKEKHEIQLENFELQKKEIEGKLKRYREDQLKVESNNKIEDLLIRADLRLNELSREKDAVNLKISTAKNTIKNLSEKIESNKDKILKIEEESKKERIYKVYLELFGKKGISKIIMRNMMPVINSELQRLLVDSAEFRLEIRVSDKDEVEFWMIDNNTNIEKLMASGSGYERTIASLALRAVLSKVCSLPKPNIAVYDEVFGKISNENLEKVGEFFQKTKMYFDKILVITHNPLVSQWADSIVKITKRDNVSSISQPD